LLAILGMLRSDSSTNLFKSLASDAQNIPSQIATLQAHVAALQTQVTALQNALALVQSNDTAQAANLSALTKIGQPRRRERG